MKKENTKINLFKLEIKKAYSMYVSGHSLKKVGEVYGVSRSTVSRAFKKEKKEIKSASESHKKGTSLNKKQQKYILKEIKSKTPLLEIAAALNITYGKLHYFLDLVKAAPGRRFKDIPENEICESYKEGVTIEQLGATYECDWKTIRGILDRNNVEMISLSERFTVSVDGLTLIHEDLMDTPKTLSKKAKELGISKNILKQRLLDDGFALRSQPQEQEIFYREKYPEFDIDFFSRKSELANYWAGFISADGAIIGDSKKKLKLQINLSQKDKGHCQKIQQILNAGTIGQYDASKYSGKIGNKIVRGGKMETYSLSSSKLCRDLIKLGITPRKTHTVTPTANLIYSVDYWRGVIDGDGTLTPVKNKIGRTNTVISLGTGSESLKDKFLSFLEYAEISDPRVQTLDGGKHKKPFYNIFVSGERARKLVKLLYADAPILGRLERKYKVAIDWLKIKEKECLTEIKILKLAKVYKKKYGRRPSAVSGKIEGCDETWGSINSALSSGYKGFKGNSSLAKLFNKHKL